MQTRKQELIEERIAYIERTEVRGKLRESEKRLSQNIYERGVDDAGFARIRSKGDQASIMLCREPTVITAELRSKHSYGNNRRGGNTYIFQVIDDDGLYEEYKVWSNTYSQYEEGDEVTILVYESVFGTEFRHLEEEYN